MEMLVKKSDRQTIIDILKGISIIFVIITHYGWNEDQRLAALFPYYIDMAVPTFMVISGYVFSASYLKKGIIHFEDAYELIHVVKRVIRYTIPFLVAYLLEVGFTLYNNNEISFSGFVINFLKGGFGPGSYYYPEMIQLTFFLPVILFSMKKVPKIGLCFWFVFNMFYELIKTVLCLDPEIYRLSLFRYTFLIAFGCYIYLRRNERVNRVILGSLFIVGSIYIYLVRYCGYTSKIINYWCGTSFVAALYIAPLLMVIIYNFGSLSFRPLELVGKASYNIE
ncbi:MAG: acyltransferase family protein [Lachnospiraceae bacterium]|nr:acyltransferase family protein [Candidatus Colinaster equi]